MRNKIKKAFSSVLAGALLSLSVTGMNSSAGYASTYFGGTGTATNGTYSDFINATTSSSLSDQYVKVKISKMNDHDLGNDYVASGNGHTVEAHLSTSSSIIQKSTSYHQVNQYSISYTNLTVYS